MSQNASNPNNTKNLLQDIINYAILYNGAKRADMISHSREPVENGQYNLRVQANIIAYGSEDTRRKLPSSSRDNTPTLKELKDEFNAGISTICNNYDCGLDEVIALKDAAQRLYESNTLSSKTMITMVNEAKYVTYTPKIQSAANTLAQAPPQHVFDSKPSYTRIDQTLTLDPTDLITRKTPVDYMP